TARRIILARIEERCADGSHHADLAPCIRLSVQPVSTAESYRIETGEDGCIRITGHDERGLLYGVGKFLRTSRYDGGVFQASDWRGQSSPKCRIRGMYLASHYYNWYHVAPEVELIRYTEDLALWGVNAIAVVFPFINLNGWEDPQTRTAIMQVQKLLRAARNTGLMTSLLVVPNSQFMNTPAELRTVPNPDPTCRRGNSGVNLCPNQPGAEELILTNYDRLFGHLQESGVDLLGVWPYDEGGCACPDCFPWGANGYLMISREVAMMAKKHFPAIQVYLSTWCYDTPEEGEWAGLSSYLEKGERWIDFIMADAHEDFPAYPLEHGAPGGLPLINFPEISMWGLGPWGGFGANPLPERFQRLWNQASHLLDGGFPYSEGIYEDINKVLVTQLYWEPEKPWRDILRDYIAYEYAPVVVTPVLEVMELIEQNHVAAARKQAINLEEAQRAYDLALEADSTLPAWAKTTWRWRILLIRSFLDLERYRLASEAEKPPIEPWNWGKMLEGNVAAQAMFRELIDIYHARLEDDIPKHRIVRPPWHPA
ncbi:MAG: hypothetical protein SCM11_18875, partial [Bacillota bacterium]|nr:hypothetical protein [Bacillota bacterium]